MLASLRFFRKMETQPLIDSLQPGQPCCLKARPDGTVLDAHHRLEVLRERGIAVESLPREILLKTESEGS